MPSPRAVVSLVAGAVLLLAGCAGGDIASGPPSSAAPPPSQPTAPELIDAARLPLGHAPRVVFLADGQVRRAGRTTPTDFPADALRPTILGSVDSRLVVSAYQQGAEPGERFWTVDSSGHAQLLESRHQSYDYAPRLVTSTGHLWVQYSDRTTPRTIWEIDALTGRDIATYDHDQVPTGLAADDQALVDAWVSRRVAVPDTDARTRDGSLRATTRSVDGAAGSTDTVVVRRSSDRSVVGRFAFRRGVAGGVARVVFEGRRHVLVVTTVGLRHHAERQVVVRCSLVDQGCERATEVAGGMALGIVGPTFEPRRGARGGA